MQLVEQYLRDHADRFVEELKTLLRIASISADSRFRGETRQAAEFVCCQMQSAGLTAELVETAGHPIVYGEWLHAGDAPTALIYGHYDVQPPDPLADWVTPPFAPDVRDGYIYARGATDDKGQMFTHLKSVEAWLTSVGRLPVNVKVIIEGEEEVGSNHLEQFLTQHKARLQADVAVISDTSQFAPGIPAITYGLRGIVACEATVRGPRQDLHSGIFGGAVVNPANTLARLIGLLHDDRGRVQIPGFYDDVAELTPIEREGFAKLPFDEPGFQENLGVAALGGEQGYSTLERRWARPTCDVNGLGGGYQGEGPKTIIPAAATAKITCRLVPHQVPETIAASLKAYLASHCPAGTTLEFTTWHGCPAFVFDPTSPFINAARAAIHEAFGVAPVLIREGGSIPVVATFREQLRVDTLLLGWGQNTDNLHSPNERFCLADFHRGTRASAHLWQQLAGVRRA